MDDFYSDRAADLPTLPEKKMPALFVGHGNPMNAIQDSPYSRAWKRLGESLPRPRAILAISAHWLSDRTSVLDATHPRTIHDFYGFPDELYQVTYPCPGAPDLAEEVYHLGAGIPVTKDSSWGIDHGTWSVLRRIYPDADIPVTQLSIDMSMPPRFHFELGRMLLPLRYQGILIIGSGNIVHNLGVLRWEEDAAPYDWAIEFDELVVELIERNDTAALVDYKNLGRAAGLAIPTPDHYLPLLSVLGLRDGSDRVSYPVTGIDLGSVSMRAVLFS